MEDGRLLHCLQGGRLEARDVALGPAREQAAAAAGTCGKAAAAGTTVTTSHAACPMPPPPAQRQPARIGGLGPGAGRLACHHGTPSRGLEQFALLPRASPAAARQAIGRVLTPNASSAESVGALTHHHSSPASSRYKQRLDHPHVKLVAGPWGCAWLGPGTASPSAPLGPLLCARVASAGSAAEPHAAAALGAGNAGSWPAARVAAAPAAGSAAPSGMDFCCASPAPPVIATGRP